MKKGAKVTMKTRKKQQISAMKPSRIKIAIENLPKHPKGYNSGKDNPNYKNGITYTKTLKYKEEVAGRKKPQECELCGEVGRICFDHNHTNEKFRGWICYRCNIVLGFVNDNVELLIKMIGYLESDGIES